MIETKTCETCDGVGRVPVSPLTTQAELKAEVENWLRNSDSARRFDARVAAHEGRSAGNGGR